MSQKRGCRSVQQQRLHAGRAISRAERNRLRELAHHMRSDGAGVKTTYRRPLWPERTEHAVIRSAIARTQFL